ncbi:putative DNA-binding domain protein [Neisseria meningitidis NM576]|jgi:hypothetical protein|nr:putative DNA-binding domain protein [Neisseria meningitidis NM183]EJU61820.1 putative DNA-binding domain protein [Neisseria meningitidis NM140]EJU63112.1 putative DNA-binding domain protein [Neisseria meningitidis NM2781]EJU68150.1 putative DNA-binding domain protein [Neisseria meningitidis NM576]EJU75699.1 putative DNA-binding domain protein [Neisseria meningitidis NM2657]CWO48120.1 putative ABC transporter related protein [Neisseria meningitidis]
MDLNVEIKNFGKVAHARVSIRPLTVITGCNPHSRSPALLPQALLWVCIFSKLTTGSRVERPVRRC